MSADVIERATEPFFTTKPASAGSGLGLSMVYGFVRQSRGHLTIDSEVGVGTTVRLYLPRAEDTVASVNTRPDEEKPSLGGNEAILLVDDNLSLLGVTQRRLTALGYRVSVAGSGPEALSILQSSAAFDLLFTDVVMPEGMSGYDLADAARARYPGLRLLFTTGYAGEHVETGGGTHRQRRVLRKPYRLRDLAKTVRAALDDHFVTA
jgi:CheY-like chemotaxis protein